MVVLGQALTRQLLVITALLAVGVPLCWASRWLGGGDAAQIVADVYRLPLVFGSGHNPSMVGY